MARPTAHAGSQTSKQKHEQVPTHNLSILHVKKNKKPVGQGAAALPGSTLRRWPCGITADSE